MNYLKKKDKILKKIADPFKENFEILEEKNFRIDWFGFGGRDDEYIQFNIIKIHSKIELIVLFWVDVFSFNEEKIVVYYSCFEKIKKDRISDFFSNKILIKSLEGNNLEEKIKFLINNISNELNSSLV